MATTTREPHTGELVFYDPDELIPAPDVNPRRRHDPAKHAELVASLRRQLMRQPFAVWKQDAPPDGEARCTKCGCIDSAACEGGCRWLAVDHDEQIGVCSGCGEDEDSAAEELEHAA